MLTTFPVFSAAAGSLLRLSAVKGSQCHLPYMQKIEKYISVIPHNMYQVNINDVFLKVFYVIALLQGISKSLLTK